ncbi:O-antigen ligase family protein [Anoxybacillus flavithermus]|uniref:O-antigen ligase-related domain-containing protein n=1 Tax=Anoxybacillus flavithermus TaxID=33934 RepID=A0A178T5X9_9BACL|nr:O-antigen ligase family protein [Anoxybacillus flavithermus]OAO76717.1 hypothetical protein TAF16_2429 [Anoxybacillus flavithermus]
MLQNQRNANYSFLIIISLIVLPFNSLPYFNNILGELSYQATFYPLCIGVIIWCINTIFRKKIRVPKHNSFLILFVFLLWILISGIFNTIDIAQAFIKGRTGIERFLNQVILYLFLILTSLIIYESNRGDKINFFNKISLGLFLSFVVVGIYSIFEIIGIFFNESIRLTLYQISPYIHSFGHEAYFYIKRVRSVAGEASWLAIYFIFSFPWIIYFVMRNIKNYVINFFIIGYMFLIIYFTYSRTAYIIILIQILIYLYMLIKKGLLKLNYKNLIILVLAILIVILTSSSILEHFLENVLSLLDKDYSSNIARIGSQIAAIQMGLNNPIFGVGLGQYAFYVKQFMPLWALGNEEVSAWIDPYNDSIWAPVHSLFARLFAELGIIGLFLWLLLFIILVVDVCRKVLKMDDKNNIFIGVSLLTSIIGTLLIGFTHDSYRWFMYPFSIGFSWIYLYKK